MNLFISFSIVLLVILASLHYLAKVKAENLGAFFKWSGNLVFLAALGLFLCLTYKGAKKAKNRMGHHRSECVQEEHGMKRKMLMRSGNHDFSGTKKMDCCDEKGMNNHSGMKMECNHGSGMQDGGCCCCNGEMGMMNCERMGRNHDEVTSETTTDTIDGKIIKKEMKIIKK